MEPAHVSCHAKLRGNRRDARVAFFMRWGLFPYPLGVRTDERKQVLTHW